MSIINVKTKVCPQCKRELPIFHFGRDKAQLDGYARTCKQCRSNYYYNRAKHYEKKDNILQ